MPMFYVNQPDVIEKLNLLAGGVFQMEIETATPYDGHVGSMHFSMVNDSTILLPASPVWGVDRITHRSGAAGVTKVTINPNGKNIDGVAGNRVVEGNRVMLNFELAAVDATQGWVLVQTPAALTPVVGVGGAGPGIERAIRRARQFAFS